MHDTTILVFVGGTESRMLGSSSSDGVWGNLGNTQGYRKPPIASPSVDRGVGPAHHRCCESTAGTRRSFGGFGSSVPLDLTMSLRVEPYTHTHTHTHTLQRRTTPDRRDGSHARRGKDTARHGTAPRTTPPPPTSKWLRTRLCRLLPVVYRR